MPWEKPFKQGYRPLFKCLWQHSVVRVRERTIHDVPSLLEGKLFLVNQDSEQFNRADGRMSVIQLNLVQVSKSRKILIMNLFKPPQDVS